MEIGVDLCQNVTLIEKNRIHGTFRLETKNVTPFGKCNENWSVITLGFFHDVFNNPGFKPVTVT